MFSPFERDLASTDIPEVLRQQYLYSVDAPYTVIFEGDADRVWHKPRWLTAFFWFLTWFQIFFPEVGEKIPTRLHIIGGRDSLGNPIHRWNRTFRFIKRDRYFNAVMAYDERFQKVIEKMGPFGALKIFWRIEFTNSNQLTISSVKCCIDLWRFRIFLPLFLYPTVVARETALSENKIYLELVASHPWLGDIFGYSGTFSQRKLEHKNE